ncbi:MAG: translocation/assembly module TamB domain-containing protein [Proteobacteria bacterium]|nr:translocation/assembly module TamB domain-containing protein [Pseudomonadota bacterium]
MASKRQKYLAAGIGVAVTLVILGAIILGLAQTNSGQQFIARQIEAAVSDTDDFTLKIGKIEGNLLNRFKISQIEIADSEGAWLDSQDIEVSWSPWSLLAGDLVIDNIFVGDVTVSRQPETSKKEGTSSDGSFSLPPVAIALEKLLVSRINLKEPVLGREMQFRLAMDVNTDLEEVIHSDLEIRQLDSVGGEVKGTLDYHPYQRTLAIDVKLNEPQGGLIARALDLPGYPEISASIAGNGELNAWRGQIRASAEEIFSTELAVSTLGEDVIEMDISGTAQFNEVYAADLPVIDGSLIGLDAALTVDTNAGEIVLKSSRIENKVLAVAADGNIDFAGDRFALNVSSNTREVEPLQDLIAPVSFSEALLDLKAGGSLEKTELSAILQVKDASEGITLTAKELTGTFSSTLNLRDLKSAPLKGSAALTGVAGLPEELLDLTGSELDLDFEVLYTLANQYLRIDDLRLRSAHVNAAAAGGMTFPDGESKLKITANMDDLSVLAPIDGTLAADIDLSAVNLEEEINGQIVLNGTDLDFKDAGLNRLVGTNASLTAEIGLAEDTLSVSNLKSTLPAGQLSGNAELPSSFETLTASLNLALANLGDLSDIAGTDLGGAGRLSVMFSGELADPAAKGTLTVTDLDVAGTALGNLDGTYDLASLTTGAKGKVSATLKHSQLTADVAADINLPDYERLELSNFSLKQDQNTVSGSLNLPFDGKAITGELKGDIPDLKTLAALVEESAAGNASFTALLSDSDGDQALALDFTGTDLTAPSYGVSIGTLDMKSETAVVFGAPEIKMTATAQNVVAEDFTFSKVTATSTGTLEQSDITFDFVGGNDLDLKLGGTGAVMLGDGDREVKLATLDGSFSGRDLKLLSPATLAIKRQTFSLDSTSLTFGEGEVTASAQFGETKASAALDIKDMSLDILELIEPTLAIDGLLNGSARLEVTSDTENSGDIKLTATNVRMEEDSYDDLPDFSSQLSGTLKNGQFDFSTTVSGIEKTAMTATGQVPLSLTLSPPQFQVLADDPLSLDASIDSNISALWALLAPDTQNLTGQLVGKTKISGSLNNPVIDGKATISNGSFEDIEQGTSLSNLTLDANLKDTETISLSLSAVDGKGGSVSSEGTIDISSLDDPALEISVKANDLLVLDRDDIDFTTDADIHLSGTLASLNVKGDIKTEEVDINIGGTLAPSVVDLKVEEINRPNGEENILSSSDAGSNIKLDVDVEMPRRVFIRGRGLDSEWEGRFNVRGTAESPVIDGYLKPVRGQFTFAGKSFRLEEGEISLLGGVNLDPELSLTARYEATNVTAIVSIDGTASDPKISFTSPDGLPEDEVLSQVLFGKSSGRLSALEAVQLAEAIASLSGRFGSGGGITGFIRDTLGVDVISAGTDSETGKAEVSIGKYVTDNVYVGVDQGAEAGSSRAKVQIDLTPNVSVETEMGQSSDNRVGIFWKWDY